MWMLAGSTAKRSSSVLEPIPIKRAEGLKESYCFFLIEDFLWDTFTKDMEKACNRLVFFGYFTVCMCDFYLCLMLVCDPSKIICYFFGLLVLLQRKPFLRSLVWLYLKGFSTLFEDPMEIDFDLLESLGIISHLDPFFGQDRRYFVAL